MAGWVVLIKVEFNNQQKRFQQKSKQIKRRAKSYSRAFRIHTDDMQNETQDKAINLDMKTVYFLGKMHFNKQFK